MKPQTAVSVLYARSALKGRGQRGSLVYTMSLLVLSLRWIAIVSLAVPSFAEAEPAQVEEGKVFYSERDENGVAEKEFSFGLRFVGGFKYFITPHWAVSFELGYTFIPANDIVEHEISDSYLGAYFF